MNAVTIQPVILAAGNGYRMGLPKVFCTFLDKSFLEWICNSLPDCYLKPIVVIRENYIDDLKKSSLCVDKWICNLSPDQDMFSSFLIGLDNTCASHLCVIPVDFPFVKQDTYQKLFETTLRSPDSIIKPSYNYKGGHPVIIPAIIKDKIQAHHKRLDQLIASCGIPVVRQDVNDSNVIKNINNPGDFPK
jgi:molybdenum cofactor cytidylyltransferase